MLELISIHIPKTAGRSFLNILNNVYPSETVKHFDRKNYSSKANDPVVSFKEELSENIKVIHGHFKYTEIQDIYTHPNTRLITWLRDPVDRVISNYSFFKKRISEAPDNYELQKRKNETLLEYSKLENSRNRMCKFIEGSKIKDFFFIGITEKFNEDVHKLGKMLSWKAFDVSRINDNREFKKTLPSISDHDLNVIRDLNADDIELYRTALEINKNY